MRKTNLAFTLFAALIGLYGVAASVIAAHALADEAAAHVTTAAQMALFHAAVLVGWQGAGWIALIGKALFCLGVLGFSGSLTVTYGFSDPIFAPLAPVGGSLLILGWFTLGVYAARGLLTRNTA